MPVDETRVAIPALDGFSLAGTLCARENGAEKRAIVVLAAATGVRRTFYAGFARHLAAHGLPCVCFDYRGVGDSRPRSLRGFGATLSQWGSSDLAGVFDWALERWPRARLLLVAHSVGGQIVGLAHNAASVDAAVFVGCQEGYWRNWPFPKVVQFWLLCHLLMPVSSRLLGYMPARRLGLGEDLPRGVGLEWARWARSKGALGGRHYAELRAPVLAYSAGDDTLAPRRAVDALLRCYPGIGVERRHLEPHELGVGALGHFGFFRDSFRSTLWREVGEWLNAHAAGPGHSAPSVATK